LIELDAEVRSLESHQAIAVLQNLRRHYTFPHFSTPEHTGESK
jgi:hypothetical protein